MEAVEVYHLPNLLLSWSLDLPCRLQAGYDVNHPGIKMIMANSRKTKRSIRYILFDLSEVLIAGLVGIENGLSVEISTQKESILPRFAIEMRDELFRGLIGEDDY